MARKSISKRQRFEIFKRDGFKCTYCGRTAATSVLHVDHVIPLSGGGTGQPENLVTACSECNLGKSDVPLDKVRFLAFRKEAVDAQREHAEQLRGFLDAQREIRAAREELARTIAERWEQMIGPISQDMLTRLERIAAEWPPEALYEAIRITALKLGCLDPKTEKFDAYWATKQAKYFNGILRNWRGER